MKVLLVVMCGLLTGFLVHVSIWRLKIPSRQSRALAMTFSLVFLVLICALNFRIASGQVQDFLLSLNWIDQVHITCFYFSAVLCYMIFYTAVEGSSPTFVILLCLKGAPTGASREALARRVLKENLVAAKIQDLLNSGHIVENDSVLEITPKGEMLFNIFTFYRRLLKIPDGKG